MSGTSPVGDPIPGRAGNDAEAAVDQWFWDHYDMAPNDIRGFLEGSGIDIAGLDVADLGCGDGIMDLGLAVKGSPRRLVGYDLNLTDAEGLLTRARTQQAVQELPACLEFARCEPERIPAPDNSFDVVITWSAFEHVLEPIPVLREIRRILRPGGTLMLQLWPFYFSEHGAHLWHWFDHGFIALEHSDERIEQTLRGDTETDPGWIEQRLVDYKTLNRITLDELHRSMLTAGLWVAKLELITNTVILTEKLNRYPLTDLGIAGVKLLARPNDE